MEDEKKKIARAGSGAASFLLKSSIQLLEC